MIRVFEGIRLCVETKISEPLRAMAGYGDDNLNGFNLVRIAGLREGFRKAELPEREPSRPGQTRFYYHDVGRPAVETCKRPEDIRLV